MWIVKFIRFPLRVLIYNQRTTQYKILNDGNKCIHNFHLSHQQLVRTIYMAVYKYNEKTARNVYKKADAYPETDGLVERE